MASSPWLLINFGSLLSCENWLGLDRSKNLTARQLASQLRARKFYEIGIEQARNDFFLDEFEILEFHPFPDSEK